MLLAAIGELFLFTRMAFNEFSTRRAEQRERIPPFSFAVGLRLAGMLAPRYQELACG